MAICLLASGFIKSLFSSIETHASLTQAVAAIATVLIAAVALYYAIRSLNALRRQTDASISLTTETFRPILEVLGGMLGATSGIQFVNKGNGAALNFRWRVNEQPEKWRGYNSNIIAPQEKGALTGQVEWQKGLVLSYNAVAHRDELLTHVRFGPDGMVSNQHEVKQGAAFTRLGWTLLDPMLMIPAFHPDLVASKPLFLRIGHWWRLKLGKERRL
jgi:hypothetical protein